MIIRNILLSWKNIRRGGVFSLINIAGLALGMAVVMLIMFWVIDELSYDKCHNNLDLIYTVYEYQEYSDGQELYTNCTPFPLSKTLKDNYPEIVNASTITNIGRSKIRFEDKEFDEGPIISTNSDFLDIFSYDIIEGNRDALSSNDQIIITEELAQMFFGNESAIGKILNFDKEHNLPIGAVIANQEANSTLNFKALVPEKLLESYGADLSEWGNNWPRTCILLAQGADVKNLDSKIRYLCKDNGQSNTTLHLFPYKKERLYSYSGKNNKIQYVYQFLGIAFIIILIASINFVNLSTALADHRRPEVGVRKVMGAGKYNILKQFLLEKGMMIFLSIILGGILMTLFLPAFRTISDKDIDIGLLQKNYITMMILASIIILPIVSAIYPSMYLSSINPVIALKKSLNSERQGFNLKSLLVVVQFSLAIILISSSIIIAQQIKYVNNYDLGYNHANLIYIELEGEARNKHEAIKQALSEIPGVESITCSDKLPLWGGNSSWGHEWEGKDPEQTVLLCKMNVDKDYFKTLGIELIEGRTFPDLYDTKLIYDELSSPQVILNQEAVRRMGLKNPIGKIFSPWGDKKGTIIGVTEDFHFESLHSGVEPILLLPIFDNPEYIILKLSPENFSQTIDDIKKSWSEIIPEIKCDPGFFENRIEGLYYAEVKISKLFRYFSFIAIFISCIGLFGLSLFIIERRKKEIGVRKVNGALISEIVVLLNGNLVKWVFIAFIIATPLAWYLMNKWLENFAFRTNLSWWIFALAGVMALGIALLTVSWQSWRAASHNPVEALRYE